MQLMEDRARGPASDLDLDLELELLAGLPTFDEITRRGFMIGALAASLLVACSDDEEPPPDPGSRVVQDVFGSVRVPRTPRRVVAGDELTLGNMLALGVTPVGGVYFSDALAPHLQAHLPDGLPNVALTEDGLDIEKVLALDPELLITVGAWRDDPYNEKYCTRYKAAMPTYCYAFGDTYEEELKGNVVTLGEVLGRQDAAEDVLGTYDEGIAALRTRVDDTGFGTKPVSVVRVRAMNDYSIRFGTTESIIFRDVGIPRPAGQRDPEEWSIDISAERLDMLNDAWALVVYNLDDGITEDGIRTSEVWQRLEPVREGRVVFVEPAVWYSNDILGALAIMDDIDRLLLPLAETTP